MNYASVNDLPDNGGLNFRIFFESSSGSCENLKKNIINVANCLNIALSEFQKVFMFTNTAIKFSHKKQQKNSYGNLSNTEEFFLFFQNPA